MRISGYPQPLTRRRFSQFAALGLVAACTSAPDATAPGRRPVEPRLEPAENAGFDAWKAGFRARAVARGIPARVLDPALAAAGYLPGVVTRERSQFHTRRTLEDYLAIAASDERIGKGRAMLRRHQALLSDLAARYGVQAEVICAIWGHESIYGERRGNVPTVSALATLAYASGRAGFFETQLTAALRILARGDVRLADFKGSWAGAMGHTQFIPTTYLAYAVDHDGDGRRDVWSDDPADALASAAAYLKRAGWRAGGLWGLEVARPAGAPSGGRRSIAAWRAAGLTRATGGRLPDHASAELVTPAGPGGPAFLLFHNAGVLRRYNNTLQYVLGVGHLSDRLAGGAPIQGAFAPDAQGLSLADRKQIQQRLTRAGYDTFGTDGVIGPKTVAAIEAWERAQGLPVTGQATRALLTRLRA